MSKFKVGDKVRVINNPDKNRFYYMDDKSDFQGFRFEMLSMAGKIVTISEITPYGYHIIEHEWIWTDEMFSGLATEHPRREFIVIRRDGQNVIASHKRGDEIVKAEKATCAPSDTFDFSTGAKLAFDRLMNRPNVEEAVKAWNEPAPAPEPPKFYTGKVFAEKIVENDALEGMRNRIGRIFEIKNGIIQGDVKRYDLDNYDPIISFSDFCSKAQSTKWHEVKSDV
jgi:hypothetical protein